MARGGVARKLTWLVGAAVFIIAAAYALGGRSVFREMRARIRTLMEPPTPAQIQRAVAAETQQARIDSIVRADTVHAPRTDPPASLAFILKLVAATVGGIMLLVVASIRWAGSNARRRR